MTTVVLWPLCGHSYVLLCKEDENINCEKSVVRNHFRTSMSWVRTACHEMVLPQVSTPLLAVLDPMAELSMQEQVYPYDSTYTSQGFEFYDFWRGPVAKDTCFGRRLKMCFQQAGVSGVPRCPAKFLLTKLLSRCCVFLVIAMCQDF